jgi:hypothetical protein
VSVVPVPCAAALLLPAAAAAAAWRWCYELHLAATWPGCVVQRRAAALHGVGGW